MKQMMAGITHDELGNPVLKVPRTLKVSIGCPKGRAIRVFTHPSGGWYVVTGKMENGKLKETSHKFAERRAAEEFYVKNKDSVPVVGYPRKLSFFTFSKPGVTAEGGEVYEPDWEAIEAAGPVPTQVKIVFMTAEPLDGSLQYWSATELKCRGNGIDAMRAVSMEPNNPAAIEAKKAGQKYFPIIGGCFAKGCPYPKQKGGCKPGSTLSFQLARNVRVGGTAFFHSVGYRTASDLFSSLEQIKTIVALATEKSLVGIPVWLKMRPYITKPEGQAAATQYAVRVEMDPVEIGKLQKRLLEQSMQGETLQIAAAPPAEEAVEPAEDDDLPLSASAMAAEFYPEEDEASEPEPPPPAAAATAATQANIGEKLRERRAAEPVAQQAAADPPPWTDGAGMLTAFKAERARLGEVPFQAHMKNQGLMVGALSPDDPKTVAVYAALRADPGDVF